ncbi:hypothetical protein JYT23_00190 [Mariprofundus ferrooxydans]|nr:hypothetical protein [Mariprofundus ferrooxydans]
MLKRFIVLFMMLFSLAGCAGVVAVGGAVSGYVVDNFKGLENSMPVGLNASMAAVQRGLNETGFAVDIIEFGQDAYLVRFANGKLEGLLKLSQQTRKLTTLYIKVKSSGGVVREASVERTVLEVIAEQSKKISKRARFNYAGYNFIRAKASRFSKKMGRYRRGADLKVSPSPKKEWLRVKMPSGSLAFLKGKLPNKKSHKSSHRNRGA